ncbi:MAG: hypothetical protein KDK70_05035 [Myxococcales bacterium]|nr:hypothetical protein [Myxococcales bacterium]
MQLVVPTPAEAEAGLRALKTVLTCQAPLNPIEARLLEAAQTHILRRRFDVEALPIIEPAELAASIERPEVREQLVSGMIVASFASGDAHELQVQLIERFAAALGVAQPAVVDLRRLVHKQLATMRLHILRHMYIGDGIARLWEDRGFKGLLQTLGIMRGWREDPELAARYRALGDLPRGTLGREYYEHCRQGGFPLPGERYAVIEGIAVHDLAHVLGGYGTDPGGEMQVAAFTAGFRREQGLYILLFVLCQFDLGVQMVPVAAPELGTLDPDAFLAALERGSRMTVDLFDDWDYWAVMGESVAVLRERYGIAAG